MSTNKQGTNAPREQVVKRTLLDKRVFIALILATIGAITYVIAYQYTHQAKLESELNHTKTQLEMRQQESTLKEQEAEQLKQRIQQLEADLQARKAEKLRIASLSQKTVSASSVSVTGTKADWLAASNIAPSDWGYVDYIISKESGWNPNARNKSSGAGGLPQALPYSKTGCAWGDAVCQLNWANSYAIKRYGSWANAYSFWLSSKWW